MLRNFFSGQQCAFAGMTVGRKSRIRVPLGVASVKPASLRGAMRWPGFLSGQQWAFAGMTERVRVGVLTPADFFESTPSTAHAAIAASRTRRSRGGSPRQPDLGTRIDQYRCFLPDLAEFSIYRREGTDGSHRDSAGIGSESAVCMRGSRGGRRSDTWPGRFERSASQPDGKHNKRRKPPHVRNVERIALPLHAHASTRTIPPPETPSSTSRIRHRPPRQIRAISCRDASIARRRIRCRTSTMRDNPAPPLHLFLRTSESTQKTRQKRIEILAQRWNCPTFALHRAFRANRTLQGAQRL